MSNGKKTKLRHSTFAAECERMSYLYDAVSYIHGKRCCFYIVWENFPISVIYVLCGLHVSHHTGSPDEDTYSIRPYRNAATMYDSVLCFAHYCTVPTNYFVFD